MSPPSTPQQTPVTTSDELQTRSIKSPKHTSTTNSVEQAIRSQSDSPPSSIQPPASPIPPVSSSRHSTVATNTPMYAVQPIAHPNQSPSRNLTATPISIDSNSSCLILPDPVPSVRCDRPAKALSSPPDSGAIDPVSFSTKSRQSLAREPLDFAAAGTSMTFSYASFSCPGSSSPYDRFFPDSVDSKSTLTTVSSTESIPSIFQQTPNVYINGLPPHFSEQDLFALARPFGDIKSVRTFTRHVSEKPTGYGFVLFGDVESAQRCIEGLRKHRSLHPSFSKVHRIPGTEYAQHSATQSTNLDENSFKSRMDKLKDTTSTNLYLEGLPLSIDEESLAALMMPYKIKSNRFFKTKLSNPPRIIAFVRLETRAAAEETIERLHGRMVRGWNDPGCRISVRFADSAEQRELRRAERTSKNGDQSPSRLTIAQAALLNLRGQELQASIRDVPGTKSQRLASSRSSNQATFNSVPDEGFIHTSLSLPSRLCYTYRESPLSSTSDLSVASEMDSLLQSVQNMDYDDVALDGAVRNLALHNEMSQQNQLRALASAALLSPNSLLTTLPRGHTQARNGFTPAEKLVLEAHAQRLQLHAQSSQNMSIFEPASSLKRIDFSANARNFDPVPDEPPQASRLVGKAIFSQDALPTISEDDFHAMGHLPLSLVPTSHNFQGLVNSYSPTVSVTTNTIFARPPSRAVSIVPPPPGYEDQEKRPKGPNQRTERPIDSKQASYPPSSFDTRHTIPSDEIKSYPSLSRSSMRPHNSNGNRNDDHNTSTVPCDKSIELQHTCMYSRGSTRNCTKESKGTHFRSSSASQMYTKKQCLQVSEQVSTAKEGQRSPPVVSPALTYSSRTPSTLSPATPFFGSFAGNQETFEVVTTENEDVAERKLKVRVINK